MIKPQPLKEGDTVAIVSPAGAIREPHIIEQAALTLRDWGLRVIISTHSMGRYGYYAGTTEERCDDIIDALHNDDIKAILCSYGGYGCIHLLDKIAQEINTHPKWIIGMSDCSALLAASLNSGVMSIHAPQCNHLAKYPDSQSTIQLRNLLFGDRMQYDILPHSLNIVGTAVGQLVGGNLSVLCGLIGTPYNMFHADTILFIEDTNEPIYRIERMLYQLKLSDILKQIKGIIIGEFTGTNEDERFNGSLYEIIHRIVAEYNIPVCFNFPVGHGEKNLPLIIGADTELCVKETFCSLRQR